MRTLSCVLVALAGLSSLTGCSLLVSSVDHFIDAGDAAVRDAAADANVSLPDGCAPTTYYRDADGDGHGVEGDTRTACDMAPEGYVTASGDCDDGTPDVFPLATETCDGVDEDCDGQFDEGLSPQATYYRDSDGDGAGDDSATVSACMAPNGYVAVGGDCALADATIFPAAAEVCDGADNDCDSGIDEGVLGPTGSALALGATRLSVAVTSTRTSYWTVWSTLANEVILQEVTTSNTLGRSVRWNRGSRIDWPAVAALDTLAGERVVVAWRENSQAVAAVVDPASPTAAAPFILGPHDGDQWGTQLHVEGDLVVAAWFASGDLMVRLIEPVGAVTQGVLMSEPVSVSSAGDFSVRPSIQSSTASNELLIAYPANLTGTSGTHSAYLGRISLAANPTWLGSLSTTAPYPDVRNVSSAPVWNGSLRTLIADIAGHCWNVADVTTGFSARCEPGIGQLVLLSTLRRRGGVVSTLIAQSGSLSFLDVADAAGTLGGPIHQVAPNSIQGDSAYLIGDSTQGLVVFNETGTSAPYAVKTRLLGCP
ncbi:MAG: putative metal-binding motif-containing protein [Sandaracinaceae bacterium]